MVLLSGRWSLKDAALKDELWPLMVEGQNAEQSRCRGELNS